MSKKGHGNALIYIGHMHTNTYLCNQIRYHHLLFYAFQAQYFLY
jgi:hypothetical protein